MSHRTVVFPPGLAHELFRHHSPSSDGQRRLVRARKSWPATLAPLGHDVVVHPDAGDEQQEGHEARQSCLKRPNRVVVLENDERQDQTDERHVQRAAHPNQNLHEKYSFRGSVHAPYA